MQMIPRSDSVGRTADVFPSKRHSPTVVPTQLLTLCYFSPGLWFTQLDCKRPDFKQGHCENERTAPPLDRWIKKLHHQHHSLQPPPPKPKRKLEKAISTSVVDLGKNTSLRASNIRGHTAWRVENWLHFGPYLLSWPDMFVQCTTCETLYGGLDPESGRHLYFWVSPCCGIKRYYFNSWHYFNRDPPRVRTMSD